MRSIFTICACVLLAARASAQPGSAATAAEGVAGRGATSASLQPAPRDDPQEPAHPQSEHDAQAEGSGGPTLHVRGFMDVDFAATDDRQSGDGFNLGQFVAHLSSSLGGKVSFFGETSFTARSNAFTVEVERAILRYDYNDRFKISVGRYHTPINYWNTAFHHGTWLQTTISRPDMIQVGGTFQPVHFVGVLAEGALSSPTAGLRYNVGLGNGRGAIISRAGDAGDVNRNRAWVAKLFARPASLYGAEFGAAVYRDLVAIDKTPGFPEWISSAYVALTREPEVIAEFSNVRHHDRVTLRDYDSQAFYVQVAARLPQAPLWKPYGRFEKILTDAGEPVLGNLTTSVATLGTRYELSDSAALKAEYRHRRRPGAPPVNGLFLQAAFTF
jgi:hypothetical protein